MERVADHDQIGMLVHVDVGDRDIAGEQLGRVIASRLETITATPAAGLTPPLVLAADLIGAKKNDAIVGITTQAASNLTTGVGDVAVFLGNNNDTFGAEIDNPFDATAGAMVAGDFNNDKTTDIIAGGVVSEDSFGNPSAGDIFFLAGEKNGHFMTPHSIGGSRSIRSPSADVLTDSGNLDLVVANTGAPSAMPAVNGSVLVYLGKGDGTFQALATLDAPNFPQAVAIADVNHDGHLDVVALSSPPPPIGLAGTPK